MRISSIAFALNFLTVVIYSSPFISPDQGNGEEEDFLSNSLYFAPGDETTPDESTSNLVTAGSSTESSLDFYPTMLQDWTDPELDASLQASGPLISDEIALSPGIFSI